MIVVNPSAAAPRLASLGFLADSDLGHRVDGGYLLVALRTEPSLHHFDPERVEYWLTADGRGRPARLTYETPVPIEIEFSWGTISIVDRLGVANDYLTFGGHLAADLVNPDLVAVFTSPAPLLKAAGIPRSGIWQGRASAHSSAGFCSPSTSAPASRNSSLTRAHLPATARSSRASGFAICPAQGFGMENPGCR